MGLQNKSISEFSANQLCALLCNHKHHKHHKQGHPVEPGNVQGVCFCVECRALDRLKELALLILTISLMKSHWPRPLSFFIHTYDQLYYWILSTEVNKLCGKLTFQALYSPLSERSDSLS